MGGWLVWERKIGEGIGDGVRVEAVLFDVVRDWSVAERVCDVGGGRAGGEH